MARATSEAVMRAKAAAPLTMAAIVPDRPGQVNERASDDTRFPERGNLRLAHAEEAREHLVGVLSQRWARVAHAARRDRKPGMTVGCGSGPTSDGTSMMVS